MQSDNDHLSSKNLAPFRDHLTDPERYRGLVWWHELGTRIVAWLKATQPPRSWVNDLHKKLGDGMSDDRVRRPWKFAKSFSRAEVERLVRGKLTWSHVRIVLGLPAGQRKALLRRAAAGEWKIQELIEEVRRLKGESNRPPRRAPKRRQFNGPRDNAAALGHLVRLTDAWCAVAATGDWDEGIENIAAEIAAHREQFAGLDAQVCLAEWRLKELAKQANRVLQAVARLRSRMGLRALKAASPLTRTVTSSHSD